MENEKQERLRSMLEVAMKPLLEKLDTIESELKDIKSRQQDLNKMIQEQKEN